MKRQVLLFCFMLIVASVSSQYNCWIQFKDKSGTVGKFSSPEAYLSARAIERRAKQQVSIDSMDLPVSEKYISQVLNYNVGLKTKSKWLNGITVEMTDTSSLAGIRALSFVKKIELTLVPTNYTALKAARTVKNSIETVTDSVYGDSYAQIKIHNGDKLHTAGFRGEGVVIGVLDGGFYGTDMIAAFDSLRSQNRLLGVKNIADTTSQFFAIPATHGTSVLSAMAANLPGKLIGSAPDASYWLIRTEYAPSEYMVEVDNWVAGIEFADSVGVDVVNSSLGYTTFDYSGMNFSYQSLNGRTSRASIAATIAARKGMVVVNAAGNDGANSWYYISTPADADSILCVGAVDVSGNHASFSSYGPTADGRIKPDVCAVGYQTVVANSSGIYSGYGTSFASPIIAGLVACVWQALPQYSSVEVVNLMKKYSSLYNSPNNSLGYGIPDVYILYTDNQSISGVETTETDAFSAYFSGSTLVIQDADLNAKAELYSITGLRLGKWDVEGGSSYTEWSSLPKGTYILLVTNNVSKVVKKIMKQ